MADVVRHKDRPTLPADDPDDIIKASFWPKEHELSGGNHGAVLVRDSGQSDGANWVQSVASGVLEATGVGSMPAYTQRPTLQCIKFLLTDPASPTNGDQWWKQTGTTGSGTLELKVYVDGATVVVLSVPF
jgi:hypothetical protein